MIDWWIEFCAVSVITATTIGEMWSVLKFWSFPGGPNESTLHRNPAKRSGVVILDTGHHLTSHPTDIIKEHSALLVKVDEAARSFGWDSVNRGPEQVRHDKDPSLLKGRKHRVMVTLQCEWNILERNAKRFRINQSINQSFLYIKCTLSIKSLYDTCRIP